MIDRGERRILSNTLAQAVAPAMRAILGVFLTLAISRYLGLTNFGRYALAFAYVGLLSGVFANWGLTTVTLREISRHPDQKKEYITSAAMLQLLISASTYVLMLGGLLVLPSAPALMYAIMLYGLTVFLTPLDIVTLQFQAELRLHRTMPPSAVGVLLNFLLTIAAIALHGPLTSLIAASVVALAVQYVWVLALARPLPLIRPHILHNNWPMLLREAWPIGFGATITGFMQQAPAVSLSFISLETVGAFSAANRFPQILALLPIMINTSSFPLLSHLAHHDRKGFRILADHLLGSVVLISVPLAIFMFGASTTIIHLLFGNRFLDAAAPLSYLGISLTLIMPAMVIGEAMIAAGKQRLNLLVQIVSFVGMIVLLLITVPRGHAVGAAIAVAACNGILLAGEFALGRATLHRDLPWQPLAAGMAGAAAGAFSLIALRPWGEDKSTVAATVVAALVIASLEWHTTLRLFELVSRPILHRGRGNRRSGMDRRRTPRARLLNPEDQDTAAQHRAKDHEKTPTG